MPHKRPLIHRDLLDKIVKTARTNTHLGGMDAVRQAVRFHLGDRKDKNERDPLWNAYCEAAFRLLKKPREVQQEIQGVEQAKPAELKPGRLPEGYVPTSAYDAEVARLMQARYDKQNEQREHDETVRTLSRETTKPAKRSVRREKDENQIDLPFFEEGHNSR